MVLGSMASEAFYGVLWTGMKSCGAHHIDQAKNRVLSIAIVYLVVQPGDIMISISFYAIAFRAENETDTSARPDIISILNTRRLVHLPKLRNLTPPSPFLKHHLNSSSTLLLPFSPVSPPPLYSLPDIIPPHTPTPPKRALHLCIPPILPSLGPLCSTDDEPGCLFRRYDARVEY